MKTMQECFDITCQHLMTQRQPALNETGAACMYRAPGGGMCAVGIWIAEDMYVPSMEGKSSDYLIDCFPDRLPEEVKVYANLFSSLQTAHDNFLKVSVARCAIKLKDIAEYFELTVPACVTNELEQTA